MQVTRLVHIEDCESIAPVWDCLAHGNPFRRTAWLHSWWRHYGQDRALYVLQVTNATGQIVGIAPWYLDATTAMGRAIHPLGSGEVCSEYLGILVTPEYEQEVIDALVQWLARCGQGAFGSADRWDVLELTSVDSADMVTRRFVQQLAEGGCHVHHRSAMDCWRLDLPDDWDEYLSRLSRKYRHQVRQFVRKWLDSGRAHLRRAETVDDLRHGMRILVDLHQLRRASRGQPGCFTSPQFSDFLHTAAERMLAEQLLDLHWLEIRDRPVAAEFQLAGPDVTYAYQSGIDPAALDMRPGCVIQAAVFREFIARGCHTYDYLRGTERYKRRWRAEPHGCRAYRVAPDRTAPRLRHQMWVAGDTMKQWLKSGLQAAGIN